MAGINCPKSRLIIGFATHISCSVESICQSKHPEIMETYEAAEKHLDNGDLQLSVRPGHFLHRHEIFSQKSDTQHPKTYETSMIYYSLSSFIIVYHHLSSVVTVKNSLSSFIVIFFPFKHLQVPGSSLCPTFALFQFQVGGGCAVRVAKVWKSASGFARARAETQVP